MQTPASARRSLRVRIRSVLVVARTRLFHAWVRSWYAQERSRHTLHVFLPSSGARERHPTHFPSDLALSRRAFLHALLPCQFPSTTYMRSTGSSPATM